MIYNQSRSLMFSNNIFQDETAAGYGQERFLSFQKTSELTGQQLSGHQPKHKHLYHFPLIVQSIIIYKCMIEQFKFILN